MRLCCGFALTLTLFSSAHAAAPEIVVAYPPANSNVPYDHVIFEGHVSPSASLSVNGRALNVGADGLFMEWLPLSAGKNALKLVSTLGSQSRAVMFNVTFSPPRALSARPTAIKAGTLSPAQPLTLYTRVPLEGRSLAVGFQGSPGGKASVTVSGWGTFRLTEQAASARPPRAAGWYQTTLTLPENLALSAAAIKVSLTGTDGKTVTATASGKVTSNPSGAARVAEVSAADVGLGVNPSTSAFATGPEATDLLFPKQGQRLSVLGNLGEDYLVQGPGGLATALKSVLTLLPIGTPPPQAAAGTPQLLDLPDEWQIRLPIAQRTPLSLEETSVGSNAGLTLTLASASLPAGRLAAANAPELSWMPSGSALQLSVRLPQVQNWGYFVSYQQGALILHLRKAPSLDVAQPLKGRVILIDPGHGGSELGGAGSLGEPEKNITLPIAARVADLLRAQGADARLTRDRDVRVALYDRPLLAETLKADLLISIHANALPDGVDPRQRRGLELYSFHPMTWGLASALLRSIPRSAPQLRTSALPPLSVPGLRVSSLALTRPTSQRSLLIEMAYLTQADDLRLLMSGAGREALAQGIAQGIADDYAQQAQYQIQRQSAQPTPTAPQPFPELTPLPRAPQPDAPLVPLPAPSLPATPIPVLPPPPISEP
ncbi:N-acetylmuramoyl-L-alanine amidase [Deinococcus psychrotolerans]|uniref:N-acetylmuramoyl-L-alanine amidase n=1 Tax=Deinococcus psychrotolerans TaxID=2489213 RepID=A0A3G8YI10_9DEIO|nr:N-acetylmuramoyl-L-alanine amidase [Deinococcus psychrotolerans]